MQEKNNKEYSRNTDTFANNILYPLAEKKTLPRSFQLDLAKLQALQECTHKAMQSLSEQRALKQHSPHVLRIAKDVYDNLLFYEENEIVNSIKAELYDKTSRKLDFKLKLGESEVCILEQKNDEFVELLQEDKEEIFSLLWELTLQYIEHLTQSVSAHRKDTIMNIKKTSFNSSPFAQASGAKSSKAYAASQVSASSGIEQSQAISRGDSIHVSSEGLLRTEAYKTASTSSDIRQKKVDDIKEKIASGTYQIDTKQLAFNLLREEVSLLL